ncbi:hypothetical protein [Joostella sp.]|uniref:hypothetical protein n=1 Tax=Joostella sp. TaxID=2231138 RepID=UPI003A8DBC7C
MKKYIVLTVLFVLPIAVYLFFASGVNNFGKLPILNSEIEEVSGLVDADGLGVEFKDKITVLGFLGDNVEAHKLNAFNLNQKIFKRFGGFTDFQFVFLSPKGSEQDVENLKVELKSLTDISNWHFVFTSEEKIKSVFKSLETPFSLNEELYSPYVFIVDKDASLRGRLKDDHTGRKLYGYDATSVAVLNNKMIDDIKVLLAEYRLAVKKNGVTEKDAFLKYNKDEE